VQQNGEALQYASKELFGKQSSFSLFKISAKKIVLAAVTQNVSALQYAPENLKKDKAILLAAAKRNEEALQDVPQELTDNKNLRSRIFDALKEPMTKVGEIKNRVNTPASSGSRSSAEIPPKKTRQNKR